MKQKNYLLGGWVDETIPREEITRMVNPLGIDAQVFCDWLSPIVGSYRSWAEMSQEMPTRNEEIQVLQDYQRTMKAALHYLTPGGLTPCAEAEMNNEWWNFTKTMLFDVEREVADKMRYLMVMAGQVERKFQDQAQKRGKKADPRKAELLANVSGRLSQQGIATAKARSTAAKVLTLCGVEGVPDTKTTLRRAAKRGIQLQGK